MENRSGGSSMEDEKQWHDKVFPCDITYENEDGEERSIPKIHVCGYCRPSDFERFVKELVENHPLIKEE